MHAHFMCVFFFFIIIFTLVYLLPIVTAMDSLPNRHPAHLHPRRHLLRIRCLSICQSFNSRRLLLHVGSQPGANDNPAADGPVQLSAVS
jgi:hypothetical protein